MSSDDPLGLAAGARIAATFRLLMQVRVLVALVALLHVPDGQLTAGTIFVVFGIALLSWLALVGWDQIVPWLLEHPTLVALDVSVAFAVLEIGGPLGPFFLFTAVTSVMAGLLYQWRGGTFICAIQVLLYCVVVVRSDIDFDVRTYIGMPLFYLVGGFAGLMLRRLFDDHARLDEGRRRAEVAAVAAEERARLAREMHDSLVKTLHGIAMAAGALPVWLTKSPERAVEEAQRIAAAAEIASREARELLRELRDEVIQQPLGSSIPAVVEEWAKTCGIAAAVKADADLDLPLVGRHEVVAILREALENIKRHAQADAVEVELRRERSGLLLLVRDDGVGIPTQDDLLDQLARDGHYGLIGMRERAVRAGGTLAVRSEAGRGTTIEIAVPDRGGALPLPKSLEAA